VEAAIRLAESSAVVTYELEHVSIEALRAAEELRPVRPGLYALAMTQDRLAERQFLASLGVPTARWAEVRTLDDLRTAAGELGYPLRLKAAIGGYDGRSQERIGAAEEVDRAWSALAERAG